MPDLSAAPYQRAACSMSAAGTSVMVEAHSGVNSTTCSRNCSKSAVRASIKSRSTRSSRTITCAMANSKATSEPTRMGRYRSAISARSVLRGSATIILAPRLRAFLMRVAATGWHSVMLVPMQKIRSGLSMSAKGFDMAPRPMVAARPATVGACQARLQLSM